ncbi:hypothetical protein ACQPXB_35850 [Amycolatopsis sp. CA-161197]|uniref:hypothetical protein n=1 Tax=Amycolatopsis sp. CA-161197 TaxID=3239922 RepID=UPI003D90D549
MARVPPGWARGAYAARGSGAARPPGQQTIPPPIPGGTASWTYQPNRTLMWTVRGWAGRMSPINYPGGGVSIRPIAERGVMRVTAWWPDATALALIRIEEDGTMYPVRGADSVTVSGTTRRNLCQNPSFEAGINGTVPDAGSPTLSNPTTGAARGTAYLLATVAAAGSCGVLVPTTLSPGSDLTVGLDLKLSAVASSVTVVANWSDANGSALVAATAALSADDINRSVATWGRQVLHLPIPPGGATGTVKVVAAGLPAGGSMGLDGVVIERGYTDASFFDGDTYGATWLGTSALSSSVLAPLATIDDGECPVDQPVRYKLVNAGRTGGSMTSDPATLSSGGRVWLTHPSDPGNPVEIFVEARPRRGRKANQAVFQAIDDPLPITVAPRRRSGWQSTDDISLWTFDEAGTEQLWALLDDNRPMLFRAAADLNYGSSVWKSFGDMAEDPDGTAVWQKYLKISGSWTEVAAPAV